MGKEQKRGEGLIGNHEKRTAYTRSPGMWRHPTIYWCNIILHVYKFEIVGDRRDAITKNRNACFTAPSPKPGILFPKKLLPACGKRTKYTAAVSLLSPCYFLSPVAPLPYNARGDFSQGLQRGRPFFRREHYAQPSLHRQGTAVAASGGDGCIIVVVAAADASSEWRKEKVEGGGYRNRSSLSHLLFNSRITVGSL